MLKFYYNPGPNPDEGRPVPRGIRPLLRAVPVDMRQGDQFKPDYLAINPNAKARPLLMMA